MIQVSDNEERLDVFSPMPSGKRFLFALFALIPLLAPYELMLRVQWNDYRHPAFLLAAIISAGAVALSGLFVFAAVAGLSSRMTLDAARSTFTYSTGPRLFHIGRWCFRCLRLRASMFGPMNGAMVLPAIL
jgi:hypothetical protein